MLFRSISNNERDVSALSLDTTFIHSVQPVYPTNDDSLWIDGVPEAAISIVHIAVELWSGTNLHPS